ncbi:MrcB family domain-containing protein [Carboxydothermus ferrireducens]|uniref:MoxR-like ATPase n=1 Tax=Carboxydothermus ferrireducens DSM 11255 TaxID=1119529 RepID=A0ABX2RCW1_9THEO|nr:DUF3578 domain-containing protein [Carboxydothermus ferrireducens]NYE58432.1 MoxR-like ATPase [Carboxydothermus ferrireducens DSM 11255]
MLRELLLDVLNNYKNETNENKFSKNVRIYKVLTYDFKDYLGKYVNNDIYEVKGSAGQGVWTKYPWVAIYNKKITNSIQEGVYIVYLFSEDMQRVYLTLNQGCTKLIEEFRKKKLVIDQLVKTREEIRRNIPNGSFKIDNKLKIGYVFYEEGSIFYKEYSRDNMPEENILLNDLKELIDKYEVYYHNIFLGKNDYIKGSVQMKGQEPNKIIQKIKNYIQSKGFNYSYEELCNFYLSLKTKPFVILAGISGTGKSKLVRLFAEAVGATTENGRFSIIPVRPDWNDNSELFGYKNIKDEFVPGYLTKIIEKAKIETDKPYFVCLDEMNLARVEYYLSDYLSLIESRKFSGNEIITDKLEFVNGITIPQNLYLIGTVNMDDTTYSFSRKVLDRTNTIEFSEVDFDLEHFIVNADEQIEIGYEELDNSFFRSDYLTIKDALKEDIEYVKTINNKITHLNEILKKANKHFGYRVRDEIVFYMLYNKKLQLLDEEIAFDYQIMQKILPTIVGSEQKIKEILIELYNFCNPNHQIADLPSYIEDAEKFLGEATYKKSAKKIIEMLRRFEDGFTSYWI